MASFVTADDKRIYDLQLLAAVVANYSLPVDLAGNLAAKKITIQQLVDYVIANSSGVGVYAGNVNPDNAFGNNGDIYFTVPVDGSRLQLFKKAENVWGSVFNLPISAPITLTGYSAADINADGNLVIKVADVAKVTGKRLIAAYYGDEPVTAVFFYRATNLISGFGGLSGAIDLTFI